MRKNVFFLLLILCISLFLNLYGIRWGLPAMWYPDEPETIEDIVLPMARHLDPNPHIFFKPSLYYYFLGTVLSPYLIYHRLAQVRDDSSESYLSLIVLISRTSTAVIGVVGVFLIYLMGKQIAGEATGLSAALLLAGNLGWAAYSHFAYMDIPMVVLLLLACFFGFKYLDTVKIRWLYYASMVGGFSISTKYNAALPVMVLLGVCHTARIILRGRSEKNPQNVIRRFFSHELFISFLLCTLTFFLGSPFVILDFGTFYSYFQKQMAISQGYKVFEESWVWFKNILLLKGGLGTGVFLIICLGCTIGFFRLLKRPDFKRMLLYLVPVVYLLYIGTWRIVAFRYVLPVVPFIVLAACVGIQPCKGKDRSIGFVFWGIAMLLSLFHAIAGIRCFNQDTRTIAEKWISKHVVPRSTVETYAYKMYLPKFPQNLQVYRVNSDYVSELAKANHKKKEGSTQFSAEALRLRRPDYIVLSSFYEERFLSKKNGKAPMYPELTRYFDQMFAGQMGYKVVAKFERNKMQMFYLNPTILIFARSG